MMTTVARRAAAFVRVVSVLPVHLLLRCADACGLHTRATAYAAAEDAADAVALLPLCIVLHIFTCLLPVDDRLRCACVCRSWRAALSDVSLWTRLDLSRTSGVRAPTGRHGSLDAALRCAAAHARGGLQSLRLDGARVTHAALLQVAAANAGALRELRARVGHDSSDPGFTPAQLHALLAAAPRLRLLAADVYCTADDVAAARRVLRNDALRVTHVEACLHNTRAASDVVALAGDAAAHAALVGIALAIAPLRTPAALDAVVDALLSSRRGIQTLALHYCGLSPASVPALTRLLDDSGGGALTTLECWDMGLLDAPAAAVLADALRANGTLTSLTLVRVSALAAPSVTAELLGALTGHVSLRALRLGEECVEDAAAAGAALGALLAANAPALMQLHVSGCSLGDDGLRALLEALPHNTHLRQLQCASNGMSKAFAQRVLLPAVRANGSLRELVTDQRTWPDADAIVRSRAAA
jgi:hypothetical protein